MEAVVSQTEKLLGLQDDYRAAPDPYQLLAPEISQDAADGFTRRSDAFPNFLVSHVNGQADAFRHQFAMFLCPGEQKLRYFDLSAGSQRHQSRLIISLVKLHAEVPGDIERQVGVSTEQLKKLEPRNKAHLAMGQSLRSHLVRFIGNDAAEPQRFTLLHNAQVH